MTVPPRAVDIAVIGGGIVGTSIAWHLARRGAGRVALFERSTIAVGASGRTGALLRRHYSNRAEATLAQAGFQTYRDWQEVVGGPPVHTPWPLIVTVDTGPGREANVERLHRNVAMQNEVGIAARVVSAQELSTLQPQARFDDIAAAALEPDSGYVDAVAATRGMAHAAIRAGATIHEGCAVLGLLTAGDRVVGVRTAGGDVAASATVVSSGAWSVPLLAAIGVAVPMTALRVQVAVLHRPLAMEEPHYVYLDTAAGMFCRPWGPGRTLIGVGGGDQHDPVDPDRYAEGNDPDYPARAIAAIARRLPGMTGAAYLHGHAGIYDLTPDAHPILGTAGPDGLFLALGFSGAGFKKGPAVGQALAELILDGRASLVDLAPFALARFATDAWRAPWGPDEYESATDFGHGL